MSDSQCRLGSSFVPMTDKIVCLRANGVVFSLKIRYSSIWRGAAHKVSMLWGISAPDYTDEHLNRNNLFELAALVGRTVRPIEIDRHWPIGRGELYHYWILRSLPSHPRTQPKLLLSNVWFNARGGENRWANMNTVRIGAHKHEIYGSDVKLIMRVGRQCVEEEIARSLLHDGGKNTRRDGHNKSDHS